MIISGMNTIMHSFECRLAGCAVVDIGDISPVSGHQHVQLQVEFKCRYSHSVFNVAARQHLCKCWHIMFEQKPLRRWQKLGVGQQI